MHTLATALVTFLALVSASVSSATTQAATAFQSVGNSLTHLALATPDFSYRAPQTAAAATPSNPSISIPLPGMPLPALADATTSSSKIEQPTTAPQNTNPHPAKSLANITPSIPLATREPLAEVALVRADTLADRLTSIEAKLTSQINAIQNPPPFPQQVAAGGSSGGGYNAPLAASVRVDQLTNTSINTPTITGGSIANAAIGATSLSVSGATTLGALNAGATTLGTTTIAGNLTMTGVLTAGTLAVSSISSGGAVVAPYLSATDTAATSTFSGGMLGAFAHFTSALIDTLNATIANFGTITATNATLTNSTSTNEYTSNLAATAARFGATATSSFNGTGTLTLASALTVPNGGTGLTALAAGSIPFGAGASAFATSSNLFWDNANGRLGVGTTSPAANLHIASPGSTYLRVSTGGMNAEAGLQLVPSGSWDSVIEYGNNGLSFFSNGLSATPVRIASNGLVGIGTTTPYAQLAVVSGATATTTLALRPISSQTANILDIYNTSGSLSSVITAGGLLGIGTTSPGTTLGVNGGGLFGGNIFATGFHDTSATTGGYKIDGTLFLRASTTNFATIVGLLAAPSLTAAATGNTAVGYLALNSATSSVSNTAVGYQALWGGGTTVSNAGGNTAIGWQALRVNTGGANNVAMGDSTLRANTTGGGNVAVGSNALAANTTGQLNVAVGQLAMFTNTSGVNNTTVGRQALTANTTGSSNIAIGFQALLSATSSDSLLAIGSGALQNNTITGIGNLAVGHNAGTAVTTGSFNSLVGFQSGLSLTTGSNNTVFGYAAGKFATSSYENTIIGAAAGQNISQAAGASFGQGETLVGYNAGNAVTTGTFNTFIGHQAAKLVTTGGSNTGVGRANFNILTTGSYNTGIGHAAGFYLTTGSSNLCLGNSACSNPLTAGPGIQTASFNIGIGEYAGATGDLTNTTAIGNYAGPSASNVMQLGSASSTYTQNVGIASTSPFAKFAIQAIAGDTNTTLFAIGSSTTAFSTTTLFKLSNTGALQLGGYGAGTMSTDAVGNVTVSSDERLKNIQGNFSRGLDDLIKLNPILYHWNATSGLDQSTLYAGFSAQNVQSAIPEAVGSSTNGYLTLQDRPVIAAIINAIKEIAAITGTFKANLIPWLGNAANGIADIAASGTITAGQQLCIGSATTKTCVTQQQLVALLAAAGQSATSTTVAAPTNTGPASLTLNGNNPALWTLNNTWQDNLGALYVHDGISETIYSTSTIDTSTSGTTTIQYWAQVPSTQQWLTATRDVVISNATAADANAVSSSTTP